MATANNVLIVGTGAMACLFAARLSAASIQVQMLGAWEEGLKALSQHGVQIFEPGGSKRSFPVSATADPALCHGIHSALVLVKSWQTEQAGSWLKQCLADDGVALTLQNGLENFAILSRWLGEERAALGSVTFGATLCEPGIVRSAGKGKIIIGIHPRTKPLVDYLQQAGFIVEQSSDLLSVQWGKLVINAAINPLSALLHVPNGKLLSHPSSRVIMADAAREAASVAEAKGIRLPYPDPIVEVEKIAHKTAENYSSMLQDVIRGAPTEIDMISGAIVRAGEDAGIPTPVNRTLMLLVKALVGR